MSVFFFLPSLFPLLCGRLPAQCYVQHPVYQELPCICVWAPGPNREYPEGAARPRSLVLREPPPCVRGEGAWSTLGAFGVLSGGPAGKRFLYRSRFLSHVSGSTGSGGPAGWRVRHPLRPPLPLSALVFWCRALVSAVCTHVSLFVGRPQSLWFVDAALGRHWLPWWLAGRHCDGGYGWLLLSGGPRGPRGPPEELLAQRGGFFALPAAVRPGWLKKCQ